MEEIWKDIPGYEGIYQVSNLGNVKSLSREMIRGKDKFISKERILKPGNNSRGYLQVILSKDKIQKSKTIHKLVAMAFLNHKPDGTHKLVVDHINNNSLDNRVENLQIISQRKNAYKTQGKYSSKYKGVSWSKQRKKWVVQIYINGKRCNLGFYKTELEGSYVYQNELNNI